MECLDGPVGCTGEVFERLSVTGASRSPRCAGHYESYYDRTAPVVAEIRQRYGLDSSVPPDWFDPTYAGERWDEDY